MTRYIGLFSKTNSVEFSGMTEVCLVRARRAECLGVVLFCWTYYKKFDHELNGKSKYLKELG